MVKYIYEGFKKLWLKILKLYSKGKNKKAKKLEVKLNKKIAKRYK
jgi:hypothetical protein|tara:strand:+ start:417 stop:551 length:135 start_codon:yes stop_codon:yes gene_type:complete